MVATSTKTSLRLHRRHQWAPGPKRVSPWPEWAAPHWRIISARRLATQVPAAPAGKIRRNIKPVRVPAGVRYRHHGSNKYLQGFALQHPGKRQLLKLHPRKLQAVSYTHLDVYKRQTSRKRGSPREPGSLVLSITEMNLTLSGTTSIRCLTEKGL